RVVRGPETVLVEQDSRCSFFFTSCGAKHRSGFGRDVDVSLLSQSVLRYDRDHLDCAYDLLFSFWFTHHVCRLSSDPSRAGRGIGGRRRRLVEHLPARHPATRSSHIYQRVDLGWLACGKRAHGGPHALYTFERTYFDQCVEY